MVSGSHLRNQFRDLERSDDLAVNDEIVSNIIVVLAGCVRISQTLHGDFAAFEKHLREGG